MALGGDLDGASVPDCLADAAAMPAFQQALLANFGEAVTRKLCYGNALAFFERMELPAEMRGSASRRLHVKMDAQRVPSVHKHMQTARSPCGRKATS